MFRGCLRNPRLASRHEKATRGTQNELGHHERDAAVQHGRGHARGERHSRANTTQQTPQEYCGSSTKTVLAYSRRKSTRASTELKETIPESNPKSWDNPLLTMSTDDDHVVTKQKRADVDENSIKQDFGILGYSLPWLLSVCDMLWQVLLNMDSRRSRLGGRRMLGPGERHDEGSE
ncbi:hypothetical protein HG531_004583 [Fusarium graminearum]|nr:hypothetical protein HG531_004583 [Fusarium graminearum]